MDSLYQRLKELDPDTFQKLCFHILKDRHPGGKICQVDGASGDEGIDVFSGQLSQGPTIWQCKSFSSGVRKSQKDQIRESLKRAVKEFAPSVWVLCLSVEMDSKTQRWFERLKESYRGKVMIGLFSAGDVVHELLHRKAIREHFFPGASLDPTELKRILSRTGELSIEELEAVNDSNLGDYIERLKARDARCDYEVVFGRNREKEGPGQEDRPGLILSYGDSSKSINVYARDQEALSADPPRFSFTVKGSAAQKLSAFLREGRSQEISSEEVQNLTTNWAFLEPLRGLSTYKLIVTQSILPQAATLKTRLVFGSGGSAVEYGFIEFACERIGTDELELVSVSTMLPFRFSFVLPLNDKGKASWTFDERFAGKKVHDVKKFVDALTQLIPSGSLEMYDLERERQLFRMTPSMEAENHKQKWFRELLNDLVFIETRFGVEFLMPQAFSKADFDELRLLRAFADGNPLSLNDLSIVLTKTEENQHTVPDTLRNPGRLLIRNENRQVWLLGAIVNVGQAEVFAENVTATNLKETIARFKKAKLGDGVPITFKPSGPVRFSVSDRSE